MGYHLSARALEALAAGARAPAVRFAEAVATIIAGFLPPERHRAAADAARGSGRDFSGLRGELLALMRHDLNPLMSALLSSRGHASERAMRLADLCAPSAEKASELALAAHQAAMRVALDGRRVEQAESLHAIADELGLGHSILFDAAQAFESLPGLGAAGLFAELGASPRAAQREFARWGVRADAIKRACMLLRAARMLSTPASLTDIAHESGYADHAHMTRAFVSSAGASPSLLRAAMED